MGRRWVAKEGRKSLNNLRSQVWGGMPASLIAPWVSPWFSEAFIWALWPLAKYTQGNRGTGEQKRLVTTSFCFGITGVLFNRISRICRYTEPQKDSLLNCYIMGTLIYSSWNMLNSHIRKKNKNQNKTEYWCFFSTVPGKFWHSIILAIIIIIIITIEQREGSIISSDIKRSSEIRNGQRSLSLAIWRSW